MKKGYIVLIVIAVLILGIFLWFKGSYNGMVQMSENVSEQWSNVENQYQRRLDLIPNLVNTVKGYAAHEQKTLTDVVNARAKATQTQISFDNLNEATMKKLNQTQGELSSALSRLMAISESYPDLKANQNFLQLQGEISDIENKLAASRRFFNSTTRELNNAVQTFPSNIFAGMFGFHREPMFEIPQADRATLDKVPEIKF